MVGSCEHYNEPLHSIKSRNFLTNWETISFSRRTPCFKELVTTSISHNHNALVSVYLISKLEQTSSFVLFFYCHFWNAFHHSVHKFNSPYLLKECEVFLVQPVLQICWLSGYLRMCHVPLQHHFLFASHKSWIHEVSTWTDINCQRYMKALRSLLKAT
jgi:hypothetical protein